VLTAVAVMKVFTVELPTWNLDGVIVTFEPKVICVKISRDGAQTPDEFA